MLPRSLLASFPSLPYSHDLATPRRFGLAPPSFLMSATTTTSTFELHGRPGRHDHIWTPSTPRSPRPSFSKSSKPRVTFQVHQADLALEDPSHPKGVEKSGIRSGISPLGLLRKKPSAFQSLHHTVDLANDIVPPLRSATPEVTKSPRITPIRSFPSSQKLNPATVEVNSLGKASARADESRNAPDAATTSGKWCSLPETTRDIND